MKEENKIRSITWIAISLIVIALWFTIVFSTCGCTPTHFNETFSTQDFREAKFIVATVVFIDSIQRLDATRQYYHSICRIYWEDTENIKWVTYAEAPCPIVVGYSMPLLTKR